MNVCIMNIIYKYHIGHVVIVMWPTSVSCVASLDSKVSIDANLRISVERGHAGTFHQLLVFYKYSEFGHTTLHLGYCFHLL